MTKLPLIPPEIILIVFIVFGTVPAVRWLGLQTFQEMQNRLGETSGLVE